MRGSSLAPLTVLALSALLFVGCASNETVKKDESMGAAVKAEAPKVTPAKPEPVVVRVEPVQKPSTAVQETAQTQPKQQAPGRQDGAGQKAADDQAAGQQGQKASASAAISSFENVYFDFDKSDLRPEARDVLTKNAETMLKVKADAKVTIEGHCDERGSAEYNLALGERRAKSVMQYLITLGVPAQRLSTISYGKEKPAVDGHDEAAWAKNRRAEFK